MGCPLFYKTIGCGPRRGCQKEAKLARLKESILIAGWQNGCAGGVTGKKKRRKLPPPAAR